LITAMIWDDDHKAYRYPGALVTNQGHETVLIPLLKDNSNTVEWVYPVEEIPTFTQRGESFHRRTGLFSVTAQDPDNPDFKPSMAGVVGLRINYPYQSATLSQFKAAPTDPKQPDDPFPPNLNQPVAADDTQLQQGETGGYNLIVQPNPEKPDDDTYGNRPYSG